MIPLVDVPHRSTQDDIYAGYYLPKDTLVVGNTWYVNIISAIPYPTMWIVP